MSIRCYIPTTLTALGAGLGTVYAVAPDADGRELGGDELEAREFDALSIAAALAATQSFESAAGEIADSASPRAAVAYDAPESSAGEELAPGFVVLTLAGVDMNAVASIHLDETEVWEEALDIAAKRGRESAEDHLGESDLLWYDVTELPELLRERG